jgi:L-asparaginase
VDKVQLLDAGGTISSAANAAGVIGAGRFPHGLRALLPPQLRSRIEELHVYRGLSEDMGTTDVDRLLAAIEDAQSRTDIGAIIVAHGTDMMAEVAFVASLLRSGAKPVLFTGAQRSPCHDGFDGAVNLRHALRVARSPAARALGVAIVFGGRIIDGQRACKVDAAAIAAFGPDDACLGHVDDDAVRFNSLPILRVSFPRQRLDPRVAIIPVGLAIPPEALALLARPPMRGFVLEAPGRGNAPAALVDAVAAACDAGMLVLLASAAAGGAVRPIYDSGDQLVRAGAIAAGDLDCRKARLLLGYALGEDRGVAAARAIIDAYLESV